MKVKSIYPNLYLYTFPNQYELASTFIRLQEFYESPCKQIRGKYFTLQKYMDLYAKNHNNKFTYFVDWNGFNVPGNIVMDFQYMFLNNLTEKEEKLFSKITYSNGGEFYIIGVVNKGKNIIKHEVAHGLYYLNKDYKREMNKLINTMPYEMRLMAEKYLIKIGYCGAVLKDELQAYFATGIDKGMISIWYHVIYQSYIQKIKKVFKTYGEDKEYVKY